MQYNWKKCAFSLAVIIFGGLMAGYLIDKNPVIAGIGLSMVASGLTCLIFSVMFGWNKPDPMAEWGIEKAYERRSYKNDDSDPLLDTAQYRVDGIAFGLSSFRAKNDKRVRGCLERGVNFRLLVMHPDSPFVAAREKEEDVKEGSIAKTILDLVAWANELNNEHYTGRIEVKGYKCMTLDFYWRIDNDIYIGPYWYKLPSQHTITYKLKSNGRCFNLYSEHFDKLWNDKDMDTLTNYKENR